MLLSQRHPALYFLSVWEKRYRRRLKWLAHNKDYARKKGPTLPVRVKPHQSALIRKLGDSNMRLQENKVVNLKIADPLINGILIEPGQTFSFWRLVGRATAKRGFKEGMNLNNGEVKEGIGGGLCDTMKSSGTREIIIIASRN